MRVTLLLADHAVVAEGKLYISGCLLYTSDAADE